MNHLSRPAGRINRRVFLGTTGAAVAYLATVPDGFSAEKNGRPSLAMIGCGGKGRDDARLASAFGDFAVVCDVDTRRAEKFAADPALTGEGTRTLQVETDYRAVLERPDIDAVICATPDHWHTKIYAEALRAGKHVYGEKPMTLTIDEVKTLRDVAGKSDRVFQVGNQQRSCQWFREAIAIARSGVLGDKLTAVCTLGAGPVGGPFKEQAVPKGLHWDRWLGPAPRTPYIPERCHATFRWWYEYSGGKLTDWGAHHLDIALWAVNGFEGGPVEIRGEAVLDPRPNCYNTPQTYRCTLTFANGNKIVCQDGDDGILFEGEREHIFVNRGKLAGNLIGKIRADANWNGRIRDDANGLYNQAGNETPFARDIDFADKGIWTTVKQNHMANFFRCMNSGGEPVSDVNTVGASTICCHLANIAMRLGRPLKWNPTKEHFIGDDEANGMLAREYRKGYEIES